MDLIVADNEDCDIFRIVVLLVVVYILGPGLGRGLLIFWVFCECSFWVLVMRYFICGLLLFDVLFLLGLFIFFYKIQCWSLFMANIPFI